MTPAARRMGKAGLLVLLLVALAGFGAGAAAHWLYGARVTLVPKRSPDRPAELSEDKAVALGRIKPAGGIVPVLGLPGDQITEILVRENATVTKGQPLVRLLSRVDREAELALLRQQLKDAETQVPLARAAGEAEIAVAQAKLDEAQRLAPFDLAAQKEKLRFLETQLTSADKRLQIMQELQASRPNTVSDQEIDAQKLLLAQSKAELEAGRSLLERGKQAQETGELVAKAQVAAARANLERTLREIPVETLKKKIEIAQIQYDRTEIKAPVSGKVVQVNGRVGDPTTGQQPILEIADTSAMQAVAEVYETDIRKLRQWGMVKAIIKSRALGPKQELTGTVTQIGTVIARNTITDIDPTADADRRVFEVIVALDAKSTPIAADFLNLQVQVFFEPMK